MLVRRAYRFRLRPHRRHLEAFARWSGCCRFVWNWFLQQREDLWHAAKDLPKHERAEAMRACSFAGQSAQLPGLKHHFPFLADCPAHALHQVLHDLDRAFSNWWAGRAEHPCFKRKGQHDAFRESDLKRFDLNGQAVKLPKLGWVPARMSEPLEGKAKQITVSRAGEHWFASVQVELELPPLAAPSGPAVGVDLGVAQAISISDGRVIQLPVADRQEERRLRRLQRRMSRKRKGSQNRRKALRRLAKARRRVVNRVHDRLHKATTQLAKNHGVVVVEDLKVQAMSASAAGTLESPGRNVRQKAGLNRAILSRCWGEFRRQLAYKCAWSGSKLIVVSPAHTSQRCSRCGHVAADNRLSQAAFRCLACGHSENADLNAARNILAAGSAVSACGAPSGRGEAGTCLKGAA